MVEQNPESRGYYFYGRHDLTIDSKNRLFLPADIRRSIDPQRDGTALFMVVGQNEKLWFYPDKFYRQIAAQLKSGITVPEDILAFKHLHYGHADRLEWDRQGRMVVPDQALQAAALGKEVTLIGIDDHLELWNRADWVRHVAELARRRKEITLKAEQALKDQ